MFDYTGLRCLYQTPSNYIHIHTRMDSTLPAVIENFFHSLHINSIVLLLGCSAIDTKVSILRMLSKKGFTVSFTTSAIHHQPTYRGGGVLDLTCSTSFSILTELSQEKLFLPHTEWLFLDHNSDSELDFEERKNSLNDVYALPGSCIVYGRVNLKEEEVDFYEVYRVAMWSKMKFNHLSKQKFGNFSYFSPRGDRSNFEGVVFRSAAVINYPGVFSGLSNEPHSGYESYLHRTFQTTSNVAQHLNFNFSTRILYSYGYEANGNFSGLMGYLQRGEIDLSSTGFMMTTARLDAIDSTGAMFTALSPLIFRQPALPTVSNIFVLPFTFTVWIAFGAIFILTAIVLTVELIAHLRLLKNLKSGEVTPGDILVAVIGLFSQQGGALRLKTESAKLILTIFSIFTFFIFIAYSAKIVALLQSSANTIKTLPQLIKSPLAVGVQNITYNKALFRDTQDNNERELYHKKVLPCGNKAFIDTEEGINRVRTGLYAFKVESDWAYKVVSETFKENEKCSLSEIKLFLAMYLTLGVPKKSGLREHLSRSICWQKEVGLPRTSKLFSKKPQCDSKRLDYTSISLIDFQPALKAILLGSLLSVGVLLAEIIINIRFHRTAVKKRKRNGMVRNVWGFKKEV